MTGVKWMTNQEADTANHQSPIAPDIQGSD
jgi:hypothetical protein